MRGWPRRQVEVAQLHELAAAWVEHSVHSVFRCLPGVAVEVQLPARVRGQYPRSAPVNLGDEDGEPDPGARGANRRRRGIHRRRGEQLDLLPYSLHTHLGEDHQPTGQCLRKHYRSYQSSHSEHDLLSAADDRRG